MAQINLLPWRDRLREQRRREFLTLMAGVIILAVGLLGLADRYFNHQIVIQTGRNNFMRQEITELDAQLAEITELHRQQDDIRARMNVITDLQGTRPVIVRIFDELARTLPDGVVYESIESSGDTIAIEGIAESTERIPELMRNVDASDWFQNTELPEFSAVTSRQDDMSSAISFSITTHIQLPLQNREDATPEQGDSEVLDAATKHASDETPRAQID